MKIKSSVTIDPNSNKAILMIPINSKKYKQLTFELKYGNSEINENSLEKIDNLIKKMKS